jgi:hypothetical protein
VKLRRIISIVVVAGFAVVLGLFIVNSPAAPRWEVWVFDEQDHPLQGMTVRLSWRNYSAETTDNQEDRHTDENGYGVFPPRRLAASLRDRVLVTMQSAAAGVHASFGPHAFVFAFGRGLEGVSVTGPYVTDWRGKPNTMQSRIIVQKAAHAEFYP